MEIGYESMADYIVKIGEKSIQLLQTENMQVIRLMFLFWTALSEADIQRQSSNQS